MRKKNDNRTFNDKKYDFMYKHKVKIFLLSFMYALCVFLISLITSNRGGLYIIVLYPLALIGFILDLVFKNGTGKYFSFSFSTLIMFISLIYFILGFFINI